MIVHKAHGCYCAMEDCLLNKRITLSQILIKTNQFIFGLKPNQTLIIAFSLHPAVYLSWSHRQTMPLIWVPDQKMSWKGSWWWLQFSIWNTEMENYICLQARFVWTGFTVRFSLSENVDAIFIQSHTECLGSWTVWVQLETNSPHSPLFTLLSVFSHHSKVTRNS